MFRHVFTLLLINTYYSSLGNPIETNATKHLLSNSLTALANLCNNEFVSNNIKSRLIDCAVTAPPYSEKQFECLMFYDINTQLCAAGPTLTLDVQDTAKIEAEQHVSNLCNTAKNWVFTNLSGYEEYKSMTDKVFNNPIICGRICGVEDVLSDDANFYCKYYKWGTEVLRSQVIGTQANIDSNAVDIQLHSETVTKAVNKPALSAPDVNNINKTDISGQPKENSQASVQSTPAKTEVPTNIEKKPETSSNQLNSSPGAIYESQKSDATDLNVNKVNSHDGVSGNIPSSNVEKTSAGATQIKIDTNKEVSSETGKIVPSETGKVVPSDTGKVVPSETGKVVPSETGKVVPSGHNIQEQKEPVLDNPGLKAPNDPDDYPGNDIDSEEGKVGLLDTQGSDDGEDPGEMDIQPDNVENKNSPKQIEYLMPLNIDSSQRQDVYPNTIQDGFSEDEDHFFPFFLSAIILVVLLYVLYHNKNKVSKMVMGLILEGRQPGRRRNSRGHAYRRLDTLEQAMSTNTAAPPSKIIY